MVVLSGYNITLVVAAVIIVMRAISLGYRARRIVALMAVPFFILMTGTGASSVRAGCMSMMGLLLEIDVRPKHSLRVLLYTLTIMTVVSPWSFIADPSLHLSFLAVIGLWYGTPICAAYMKKVYQIPWIGKLLTETVSVQLIVLPYILFMSGSFSMLSLIANLLTVPLVPLVMLTGMVSLVIVNITTWISLGQIGHIILMVVRIPAEILLQWIYYVAQYVAGKDGWIVSGVVLNKWMLIVGYLLAGIGIMWWHWRHPQDMGNT
jgi:competence protein ComEC